MGIGEEDNSSLGRRTSIDVLESIFRRDMVADHPLLSIGTWYLLYIAQWLGILSYSCVLFIQVNNLCSHCDNHMRPMEKHFRFERKKNDKREPTARVQW